MITRVGQGVLLLYLCCWMSMSLPSADSSQVTAVQVSAKQHEPLKLLIIAVGNSPELQELATLVSKNLAWSGQFAPDIQQVDTIKSRKMITAFADQYPLLLFLTGDSNIEWRLYDTMTGAMIRGKRYHKRGSLLRGWAHDVSDLVWTELTGQPSAFASKIAYCKQIEVPGKKPYSHIIIADYDGSNAQTIVSTPTLHVAPRWNGDPSNPLLFYSEGTPANIRLMCVTMQGKRKIASNFDGINMLPTFSNDGKKVVYCASKGHGNCQLYLFEKGTFKRLTHNDGNNVSPSLSQDGKILFYCSDVPTGKPQIYRYDFTTKICKQITKGGYNFCPQYHQATDKLVYSSLVQGDAQLFLYDPVTDVHKQITFGPGNKDECFWSPCGSYIIFSVEQAASSRIAVLNINTCEIHYITGPDERCFYPCWSPLYRQFPLYSK